MKIEIKSTFIKNLLLIFWLILPYGGFTQISNLRFEKVEIPDAPPIVGVDCIYEDSRGLMWFGTYAGLNLFDGYKITRFENDPNAPLSISDNKIKKILEDRKGNLWIGTQNGLNYLDVKQRTFNRFIDSIKYGMGVFEVNDIKIGLNGRIWIANVDGLYVFDSIKLKFSKIFPKNQHKGAIINAVEFENNKLLIATTKGLYIQENKESDFKLIHTKNGILHEDSLNVTALQKDKSGNIWIGSANGLYIFRKDGVNIYYEPVHSALAKEYIYFINPKNESKFWIGSNNGLLLFDINTAHFERYNNDPTNLESIPKNNVERGFQSSYNTFWVSTISDNLHKIDLRKSNFNNVRINAREVVTTARLGYELYEYSPDTLLIPQKTGASFLNIKTKKSSPFPYTPSFNIAGWKTGMICFLEESDGKLWIGTNGGLFLFDKKQKVFIDVENELKDIISFRQNAIRKIHRDKKGNLWVGTWHHGICKIDFTQKTFKRYNNTPELLANLISNTRTILEDRNGTLWIGTRGGLLKYMEQGDTFKVYRNIPNDSNSMSENTAFCIFEDKKGNIWCGTYGGGLNKLDTRTGKFKHYTISDGLLDNTIFCLIPDKKGNLWANCYKGISVFNPLSDSIKFISYKQSKGLLNEGFDAFMHGVSRYSDRFFFAGANGIDFFNPNDIQPSAHDPNIYITDFKLFNKTVPISRSEKDSKQFYLPEDISFTKHLELAYEQNVIGFDFAALDFSSPKNIQYAYILEGFDTAWQYIGNIRSATFTNLNPGDYTFKVKATNGDGVWGTKTASIKLTILAPWWQTWWFRALVMLTLFSLGFAFYQYRIRQIKEREAIKTTLNKRIAEVKMEALRSQMNPHFIFNALTSINLFILKNDSETASFYLNKFSRLMREVLNHSRSDLITVEQEINTLKIYVEIEKMRFKNNFNYIFDIQPSARMNEIQIPPLIIQPYVENAIWHGLKHKKDGDAILKIVIYEEFEYFYIRVEDNGIGRAKALALKKQNANQHVSHGINVTEERIKQYNEAYFAQSSIEIIDLVNNNQEPIGTQIVYKIKT